MSQANYSRISEIQQASENIIYTDGITEAPNRKYDEYGEERLFQLVKDNRDKSDKVPMVTNLHFKRCL